MASTKTLLTLGAIALAAAGCAQRGAPPADPAAPVITGEAAYRVRLLLPPGAVFEATLEDVTRVGAPSEVIGRTRIVSPPPPPFPFEIRYDPARVVAGHRYVVRATIRVDDTLRFLTDTAYPVLGADGNQRVKLDLRGEGGMHRPVPAANGGSDVNAPWP